MNKKNFKIAPKQSRFTLFVRKAGLLKSLGHDLRIQVKDFSGIIEADLEHPEASSLIMKVPATSLRVCNAMDVREENEIEGNMFHQVLEVEKFSEIRFRTSQVILLKEQGAHELALIGNLSLHGVERTMEIPARVSLKNDELRAQGTFLLKQSEFRITPFSAMGGLLKVKDELELDFDILALAQDPGGP